MSQSTSASRTGRRETWSVNRERWLARAARTAAVVGFVSIVVDAWLSTLNPSTGQSLIGGLSIEFALVVYLAVGGFLASRRPTNVVGWALLAVGFFGCTNPLAMDYARYGLLTAPGSLPAASLWAWYASWGFEAVFFAPLLLILFYPDGRLLSPRWRWVVYLIVFTALGAMLPLMVGPRLELGQSDWNIHVPNPVAIPGVGPYLRILGVVANITGLFVILASFTHLVIRYVRAERIQRLQVKWFLFASLLAILITFVGTPIPAVGDVFFGIGLSLLPLAVAVAIQRYRLFDIERIISRTLAYALSVGLLFGMYLVIVLLVSGLGPLEKNSPLVVALSTLAVAALFRPVVTRSRTIIDKRFNRSRYDAQKTLEGFSQTLRDQTDVERLRMDLLGVVATTMQPSSASLWIRHHRDPTGAW